MVGRKLGFKQHPGKSRLIEFGRHAASRPKVAGPDKSETFDFLGFTHLASKTRNGRFVICRQTIGKRQRRKLQKIKRELRRRPQGSVLDTGRWLRQVLLKYYRNFAVPYNLDSLNHFRLEVGKAWLRALRHRSQKASQHLTWENFKPIQGQWLPMLRIVRPPWPNVRSRRRYPKQEPCAVTPLVRIGSVRGCLMRGIPTVT